MIAEFNGQNMVILAQVVGEPNAVVEKSVKLVE